MKLLLPIILTIAGSECAYAQEEAPKAEITLTAVTDNIYMLAGTGDGAALASGDLSNFSGGNIGLLVGPDGVLIIDAKMAAFANKVKAAIKQLGGDSPRFILDTHWHNDHINGHPEFRRDGTIIAHDNARTRIIADKSEEYWPIVTFDQSLSIHLNGEEIRALHYPAGHTDGDVVIYFVSSNVVHMGDLFFSGYLPYVDLNSGGTVQGYMKNVKSILDEIPDDVQIIPGHGPVSSKDDLRTYYRSMTETVSLIREQMQAGKSLEEIQEAGLPDEWDEGAWFLIPSRRWIEIVYKSYSN
jgi:glyoxylase-like metal-dependent hydrolase (beta-lactamase superfamily II)